MTSNFVLKFAVATTLGLCTAPILAAETVEADDFHDLPVLTLESSGGELAASAEIYASMKDNFNINAESWAGLNGSNLLTYQRLSAEDASLTQFITKFTLPGITDAALSALAVQGAKGTLHLQGPTAGDLSDALVGDDESDATTFRVAGQYVRCSRPQGGLDADYEKTTCDLSLVSSAPLTKTTAATCELSIQNAVHVTNGPMWGDGEELALAIEVAPALRSQVIGVYFRVQTALGSTRLAEIAGHPGFYSYSFDTILNPHGGDAEPQTTIGTFVVKLKNGQNFEAKAAQGPFTIDSTLAGKVATTASETISDTDLLASPSTKVASDAASLYLNPKRCP